MTLELELAFLLEGVDSPEAREKIVSAYHSLSAADPDGFAVQFAILGTAIASRVERAVTSAQASVAEAAKLDHSPDAIAQRVLKDVPHFRDMKQLAESLKLAVNHLNQTKHAKRAVFWNTMILTMLIVNTFLLLWILRG